MDHIIEGEHIKSSKQALSYALQTHRPGDVLTISTTVVVSKRMSYNRFHLIRQSMQNAPPLRKGTLGTVIFLELTVIPKCVSSRIFITQFYSSVKNKNTATVMESMSSVNRMKLECSHVSTKTVLNTFAKP